MNPELIKQQLGLLPKEKIIESLREAGQRPGDTARTSKGEYLSRLLALGDVVAVETLRRHAPAALALIEATGLPAAKTVPLQPRGLPAPEPVGPEPKIVAQKTLGELFGIRGKAARFVVSVWNDPNAPELDPAYRWDAKKLHLFAAALERGRNAWLGGPAGTGKTEFVRNFCAATGRAFVRVSFDSGIERYELLGGERVRGGDLVYVDGIVLRAMRRPGAVCLLDEVGFARPEYLSALHAALEPAGIATIPETGETVRKADGMAFVAADNTLGSGDEHGAYHGVRPMNRALLSRFGTFISFDYLAPSEEAQIIAARTKCYIGLAEQIVAFLNVCRQAAAKATIDHPPGLREAFALAEMISDGLPPRVAFEAAMVHKAEPEAREQLQQVWKANITEAALEAAAEGRTIAAQTKASAPNN